MEHTTLNNEDHEHYNDIVNGINSNDISVENEDLHTSTWGMKDSYNFQIWLYSTHSFITTQENFPANVQDRFNCLVYKWTEMGDF